MGKDEANDLIKVSSRWGEGVHLIERHPTKKKIATDLHPGLLHRLLERYNGKRVQKQLARIELALAYLSHPDPQVRLMTIPLAKDLYSLAIPQTLVDLFVDPSSAVRLAAVETHWQDADTKQRAEENAVKFAIRCLHHEISRKAYTSTMSAQQANEALELLRTTRPARWEDFNAWLVNIWCFPYDEVEDETRPYTYEFFPSSEQIRTQNEGEVSNGTRLPGIVVSGAMVARIVPDNLLSTPVSPNHENKAIWSGISVPADNTNALMSLVVDWYNLNTHYCDKRRFLETHLELLDTRCDCYLDTLIELYPAHKQDLHEHKLLIGNARRRGKTPEAVRAAYIDMYGSLFTLDLSPWLSQVVTQIVRLLSFPWLAQILDRRIFNQELMSYHNLELSQVFQTEAARILLLRSALTYAQTDTGLAPEILAALRFQLASALRKDKNRVLRQAIEEAIEIYQAALEIYTIEHYPQRYATIQQELALTYQDRIVGSRRDNLEQAIVCCNSALSVFTQADFPLEYARNQNNLGSIYLQRITDKRENNVKEALRCYTAALQIFNDKDYPFNWAMVRHNQAEAYQSRVGNKAGNLEAALLACQDALHIRTLQDFPEEFAQTATNLGSIYSERIAGNARDNLEQAIVAYNAALRVFTIEDFPRRYAALQCSLGLVYQQRIAGSRQNNLGRAITCFTSALKVFTIEDFPLDHCLTQLNLADLTFNMLVSDAERYGIDAAVRKAYTDAHQAFAAARRAQAELGWQESDEQGRVSLSSHPLIREMYVNDAWCLWQLGNLHEAVVALEAGRAQALVEAQAIVGVTLDGICEQHAAAFVAIRQQLQDARREGNRTTMRATRDAFLQVRRDIRAHCKPNFLPDEPTYQDIACAAAEDQAILYLAATKKGGLGLVVPPAQGHPENNNRSPILVPLPQLTSGKVDEWFDRRDEQKNIVGGYRYTLQYQSSKLLWHWVAANADGSEQERRLAMPLREVVNALPPTMDTLHDAMQNMLNAWRLSIASLSNLKMPLSTAMRNLAVIRDLTWYLQEAELEYLLQDLRQIFMETLRHNLTVNGLGAPDQRIAFIPCGRLGILPVHAAWVGQDRQTGTFIPFQETCELTIQPGARTLASTRVALAALPSGSRPLLAVGNPLLQAAPQIPQLKWAEAEAKTIAQLFRDRGHEGGKTLIGQDATLARVKDELRTIRSRRSGSWVLIASHGQADPSDPNRCYLVLAGNEKLTLVTLQRERLLEGLRIFIASGCVTGLGDFENAPDELSSFAAGILQAGSPCAVATLWSVSDHPTFLLMLRFTQNALDNPKFSPASSMRDAAQWLRQATREELQAFENDQMAKLHSATSVDDYANSDLRGIPETAIEVDKTHLPITGSIPRLANSSRQSTPTSAPPYKHAIYWAATVVYGI